MLECDHKGEALLMQQEDGYGIYLCICGQTFIRLDEEEGSIMFNMLQAFKDDKGE